MRFQVKPRITALIVRAILEMILPGSSPETAAMDHAVWTEAGPVPGVPAIHAGDSWPVSHEFDDTVSAAALRCRLTEAVATASSEPDLEQPRAKA